VADELTLTIRVHDPKEKRDASMSACWAVVKVERADVQGDAALSAFAFVKKYVTPALSQLKNLGLKTT